MKRCEDCISVYGITLCCVKAHYNKATGLMAMVRDRSQNTDGKCPYYHRKWYKFWRKK